MEANTKLSVGDHEEYSEIVSMSTLGKAYETYDQVPVRRNALESNIRPPLKPRVRGQNSGYVNIPPREDENVYDTVVNTYQNVVDTPTQVEEVNYSEITAETDVDKNNYEIIRHSDSGTGTGSGGAEPKEWLPLTKPTTGELTPKGWV